jgi:hypothetical protein
MRFAVWGGWLALAAAIESERDWELHAPPIRLHAQGESSRELRLVGSAFDNDRPTFVANFARRWEQLRLTHHPDRFHDNLRAETVRKK